MKKKTTKPKPTKRSVKKTLGTPLATVSVNGGVCLLERLDKKTESHLFLSWSVNGIDFSTERKKVVIKNLKGKEEKIEDCESFSMSRTPNGYVMTYLRVGKTKAKGKGEKKGLHSLVIARSRDLYEWNVMSENLSEDFHKATVAYSAPDDMFELYRDGLFIQGTSSRILTLWKSRWSLLFTSRNGRFDEEKLSIIGSAVTTKGILLLYDASVESDSKVLLQVGAVLFDIKNPKNIIWRSDTPVWQGVVAAKSTSLPVTPIGFAFVSKRGDNRIHLYWSTKDKNIIIVSIPAIFSEVEGHRHRPKILDRFHRNPIVEPREHHEWEVEGTFNPAAVEDDEGVIHLLYRAIGRDGISRVGYAKSKDGLNFSSRSRHPVFEVTQKYTVPDGNKTKSLAEYNPTFYTSGGSWSGAEDPRLIKIGDKVYMIYVAFDGWYSTPRLALTWISLKDFKDNKWKWKRPILISPPNEFYKNWLLFPEKINGKFALLHSIEPSVLVEYIDDVNDLEDENIRSRHPSEQKVRTKTWDNRIRGSGPPPLKTEMGWLLLYHATEITEPSKYKIGAMLLDLKDPTKVLYRSKHPILSPDMHYENNGKPGVVYASGALIKDGDLYVYYGGADKVCCVAKTKLDDLLKYLTTGNTEPYELKLAY